MDVEDRAVTMVGVSTAFFTLAWLAFFLRVLVKSYIMRSFGIDDWLMVVTIIVFTTSCGLLVIIGSDMRNVEVPTIFVTYQVFQFALYTLANVFLKASLGITFHRILTERWQRNLIQTCVGIHTVFGLATFFFTIFRCGNPVDFYDRYHHAMCISWDAMQGIQYTNSAINTSVDWLLTLLPIFALRSSLVTSNHQAKVSACVILILGCISSITSMPRFGYIHSLGGTGASFWQNAYPVAVLGIAENGTGIAAACLLTLRPLIRNLRERSEKFNQSVASNAKTDAMEEAEFGEAKAVSIRAVYPSSRPSTTDSGPKSSKQTGPSAIFVNATEVDISPQISPVGSYLRRRSSCKVSEVSTIHNVSLDTTNEQYLEEERPRLSHQRTANAEARPWRKAKQIEISRDARDRKRLTWNDLHSQWASMHVSRAAYHGRPAEEMEQRKSSRMSMKRLTMLFPHWNVEEE